MQIQFLGAAGVVTGSCYVLTGESGQTVMIDCGLFQGTAEIEKNNFSPIECDCTQLSGIILTHAHLDHCGRLPTLLAQGFHQDVWMTPATRDITEISLYDAAKINAQDHPEHPLYEEKDVTDILNRVKTIEYDQPFSIGNFSITFRDAGHILGSAMVEIIDQSATSQLKKVVFSGDLGNTPQDLICPTAVINSGDVVVMESTYGDRVHPIEDSAAVLQSEIQAVEANSGTLLIPCFSIERSQELLHLCVHLKKEGRIKEGTPIYFDSPMAEKVTAVFEQYPQLYNEELKHEAKHGTPFHFPGLRVVMNQDVRAEMNGVEGAKVIVAGSGMMNGGRIVSHAQRYLPLATTRLLFVGYQSEATLGRSILEGQKSVKIKGEFIQVNATVNQTHSMSSHADQPKLLNWLARIEGVKKVFLTHGEDVSRQALAAKIQSELHISEVILPKPNQVILMIV